MKISFVVPAYNEEARIGTCIEAIRAEIARAKADAEIIVVNNASTDATREKAAQYAGVSVVDEPRKGLVRARQAGFANSSGDLIANIDADVRIPPGWLDAALARFASDERLVALSGPFVFDDVSRWVRALVRVWYLFAYILLKVGALFGGRGAWVQGGNFVLRRDALARIGGFDTSIEFYGEDTDIAQRIAAQGRVVWTWKLWAWTSGRRLKHEGLLRTGLRYALNYFSVTFLGKPFTKEYADIRYNN